MTEVTINDKQKYLNENYPFEDTPQLSEQRSCLRCGKVITVKDYKVYKDETGEEYICCPNAPECNGSIIDWMPVGFNA